MDHWARQTIGWTQCGISYVFMYHASHKNSSAETLVLIKQVHRTLLVENKKLIFHTREWPTQPADHQGTCQKFPSQSQTVKLRPSLFGGLFPCSRAIKIRRKKSSFLITRKASCISLSQQETYWSYQIQKCSQVFSPPSRALLSSPVKPSKSSFYWSFILSNIQRKLHKAVRPVGINSTSYISEETTLLTLPLVQGLAGVLGDCFN